MFLKEIKKTPPPPSHSICVQRPFSLLGMQMPSSLHPREDSLRERATALAELGDPAPQPVSQPGLAEGAELLAGGLGG